MSEEPSLEYQRQAYINGCRNRVKDLVWNSNPDNQIYSDEDDDIYVIRNGETTDVYAYLHGGHKPFLIGSSVLEFIDDLKKLCIAKSWKNCQIKFVTDFELRHIFHTDIKRLDRNIVYLKLKVSAVTGPFVYELIPQNLNREIEESETKHRLSKIMPHSNFDPDSESAIMNAIKNGNGDMYGLG